MRFVDIDRAACTDEAYDPKWWMPTEQKHVKMADKAIKICIECPERKVCLEYGADAPFGVFGGRMPPNLTIWKSKVCIECHVKRPLAMFHEWGENGRRRKWCYDCDPRFSLADSKKVCIECHLKRPLTMFHKWGENGRRRKWCYDCDPRFSLADSKEDATP